MDDGHRAIVDPTDRGSLDSVRDDGALATFKSDRLIMPSPDAEHLHGQAGNGHATD